MNASYSVLFWRMFVWFFIAVDIAYVGNPLFNSTMSWAVWVMDIVIALGLFLLAYERQFLPSTFWRIWFPLMLIRDVVSFWSDFSGIRTHDFQPFFQRGVSPTAAVMHLSVWILFYFVFLSAIPLIGLYLYAFKRSGLLPAGQRMVG